jgi:hypothetical protein
MDESFEVLILSFEYLPLEIQQAIHLDLKKHLEKMMYNRVAQKGMMFDHGYHYLVMFVTYLVNLFQARNDAWRFLLLV